MCEENTVVCAVKEDSGKYLCVTTAGELDWFELDSRSKHMLDFQKAKSDTYNGIPVVDVSK